MPLLAVAAAKFLRCGVQRAMKRASWLRKVAEDGEEEGAHVSGAGITLVENQKRITTLEDACTHVPLFKAGAFTY
jgi:hypothetical protein